MRRREAHVLLLLLSLSYKVSYMDRTCMSVLQVPIKAELGLRDAQLGLLTGPAFAVLYAVLSVPLARLSERVNQASLMSACLLLWSGGVDALADLLDADLIYTHSSGASDSRRTCSASSAPGRCRSTR